MNKQRKVLITITYNEMGIIIDTKAEEVAQPNLQPTCNQLATDTISRQAAIDALDTGLWGVEWDKALATAMLKDLPSARPEPLSDAYMKSVWTWLLEYQIKAAELKGRYTPYEVLSWVVNDWRKEHEGSD